MKMITVSQIKDSSLDNKRHEGYRVLVPTPRTAPGTVWAVVE